MKQWKALVAIVALNPFGAVSPVLAQGLEGDALFGEHIELARAVSALRATRGSVVALRNASPATGILPIAAYRDQVLNSSMAEAELDAAKAYLGGLPVPTRRAQNIRADLEGTRAEITAMRRRVQALEGALETTGAGSAAQIAAAQQGLAAARRLARALRAELTDTRHYERAEAEVSTLAAEVAALQAEAQSMLLAAAQKEVPEVLQAEVNRLLGLPDGPLSGEIIHTYSEF